MNKIDFKQYNIGSDVVLTDGRKGEFFGILDGATDVVRVKTFDKGATIECFRYDEVVSIEQYEPSYVITNDFYWQTRLGGEKIIVRSLISDNKITYYGTLCHLNAINKNTNNLVDSDSIRENPRFFEKIENDDCGKELFIMENNDLLRFSDGEIIIYGDVEEAFEDAKDSPSAKIITFDAIHKIELQDEINKQIIENL